jgi:hypothetical protein
MSSSTVITWILNFHYFIDALQTDIVMPMDSSHRHRCAAVRILFSRMNQCHVNSDENTKD